MGRGIKIGLIGFAIGFVSMFIPVLGIPGMLIGGCITLYGAFVFWFGAAKSGVKAAKRAAGDKTGTGKL